MPNGQMEKAKTKTIFSTALSYSDQDWPTVSTETSNSILSLLIPIVKPIGDYNRDHVGKSRRRGGPRKPSRQKGDNSQVKTSVEPPAISQHVRVGFNSNLCRLEELARLLSPSSSVAEPGSNPDSRVQAAPPAILFACRSAIPQPICQSIPLLVAAASARLGERKPIRLIEISVSDEATLSSSLGVPRVSVLGLDDATPGAGPLFHYAREQIKPVYAPWLQEARSASYLALKVHTEEVKIGNKKDSRKRKAEPA